MIDFTKPIDFPWRPLERIPHTSACTIAGVWLAIYEHPSDKSYWIAMTGMAGDQYPSSAKRFPDRSGAEAWATDTLRLLLMARQGSLAMTDDNQPDTQPEDGSIPPATPPVVDPPKPEDELNVPPSDFAEDDDELLEDDDDADDTGFEDDDDETEEDDTGLK